MTQPEGNLSFLRLLVERGIMGGHKLFQCWLERLMFPALGYWLGMLVSSGLVIRQHGASATATQTAEFTLSFTSCYW